MGEDSLHSSKEIHFDTGVVIAAADPKLGAIFSPREKVLESANRDIRSKYIMGSYRQKDPVSPHTVMGASCVVVGLVILSVTGGLVARRYSTATAIKIPKEGAVDTQVYSSEGVMDSSGATGSTTSYLDMGCYKDTAEYSYSVGEAEKTITGGEH